MKTAISSTILKHIKILIVVGVSIISLATLGSKNHTTNITKIVTQSIGIIIKRLYSVVSQRESVKNDKPTISMSLSHCIHQTLNSKASTRFHSGGLQQSCQILEAFLWFVLITLLNVTLIILTLSVSRLLNLLLRLVAFLLFLNPQCLASISRWITASSSWKRFCLFVCRALSSIMVICMLTAIRLLLTFVMSLYLLLRS